MAKSALVVDDSLVIRKMVSMALTSAGFDVQVAVDGKDALDKAKGTAFSVVITDLNMPVMDGLELIKGLRDVATYKFTPIIFLTTETDVNKRDEAREAGATAWVQKPFQPEKILSVVNRIAG